MTLTIHTPPHARLPSVPPPAIIPPPSPQAPASSWRLVAEEHAWRVGRTSLCTVLSLPFPTYSLGPGPDADETRRCPESALFGRLRSLHPRERISLRPGRLAVAVVDTNWVLRSKYELVAVRQRDAVTACQGLQTAEAMVVAKKEELGQVSVWVGDWE